MVKNNFKIATRSLMKHRFYTGINLVGISLGIACFIMTYLYVQEELSFDKFHTQKDRIYRVWVHEFDEGDEYFSGVVPIVMSDYLATDFPEIDHSSLSYAMLAEYSTTEGTKLSGMVRMVSPGFLKMFDFPLLAGNMEGVLDSPEDIVLTESEAIRVFGTTDVIGKTVKYNVSNDDLEFVVSGLIADTPANSSLQFTKLISDTNKKRLVHEQSLTAWYNFSTEIYIMLDETNDPAALEAKFPEMVKTGQGEDYEEGTFTVYLQPLTDMYFDQKIDGDTPTGDIATVRILGIVGFIILVLAGINFVNLSVGQSMARAREVGVRKVMGAFKGQLTLQFLTESLLLTVAAAVIGLGVSYLLLPLFNDFANKHLTLTFEWPLVQALLLAVLFTGILSGLYPAFVLSSFKPSTVLKGLHRGRKGKSGLATSLTVLQYVAAIFFVSTAVIMKSQLQYISQLDMGFDKEAKVFFTLPIVRSVTPGMDQRMKANADAARLFKTELEKITSIEQSTVASNYFGDRGWLKLGFKDKGDEEVFFRYNHIDEDFTSLFDIEIVAGKSFENATDRERETGILVNERFVRENNIENPIGYKLEGEDFPPHEVIGVVSDFNFASLREEIEPLVMSLNPEVIFKGIYSIEMNSSLRSTIIAQVNVNNLARLEDEVASVWEARYNRPFELGFLDDRIERMYEQEKRNDAMVSLIALLAIAIASLGLLGLIALTVQNKFKEIGVRKVLGASAFSIVRLLNRAFMSPIAIALLLSVPLTYFVMDSWLSDFAYHITINPLHFLAAGAVIFITTLLVASYQSVRAATSNPVDTLRDE